MKRTKYKSGCYKEYRLYKYLTYKVVLHSMFLKTSFFINDLLISLYDLKQINDSKLCLKMSRIK